MFSDALMLLPKALGETVYMVAVSMIVASAIGIPLGVLLLATGKNQVLELGIANKTLNTIFFQHTMSKIEEVKKARLAEIKADLTQVFISLKKQRYR